jgi:hypothetical protein
MLSNRRESSALQQRNEDLMFELRAAHTRELRAAQARADEALQIALFLAMSGGRFTQ